jgi:DNA-binding NarL/FixJ family response regulator
MIRVQIVDDIPLFRAGLRCTLEQAGGYHVVGEATRPDDILQMARSQQPDIILLSQDLTTAPAFEIARLLFQSELRGVFVLADPLSEEQLFQYQLVGAVAYEPRWISPEELAPKLWRVSQGEYLLCGEVIETFLPAHQALLPLSPLPPDPDQCPLSQREMQLLVAIAQGMSNKQIAHALALSEQVVHQLITSLLRTVGVAGRTEAVMKALRLHWLDFPRIEEGLPPDAALLGEGRARPPARRKASLPHERSPLVRLPANPQVGYRLQTAYCGKPSCKKCRTGQGHGPYWYAYQTRQGRTVRRYVGKSLPVNSEG